MTGDPAVDADLDVLRSTALGWMRSEYQRLVTVDGFDMDQAQPRAQVVALQHCFERLAAVIRLLLPRRQTVP